MLDKIITNFKDVKVSVPVVVLAGLVWLGFKANDLTVSYLSEFFFPKAEAQELAEKVNEIEKKVDSLDKKLDSNRVRAVEQEIFRLVIERCMAGGQLRVLLTNQIAGLVTEWRALTGSAGQPSTLVECGDLG